MLKNTGVKSADEIRSPSETESELVRCVLEARGMCSGGAMDTEGLTPKFRGARLAWPKRAVVEASPATPS